MGLLDNILTGMQSPGGRMGLGLLAAAGPTAQPRSFGQRAMGLLAQMDADKAAEEERKQRAQMQALQEQLLRAQLGERQEAAGDRQRVREQAATDERVLRNFFTPMDGPTPDGGPLMPRIDPATAIQQGASLPGVQNLMALNAALQPKPRQRNVKEVGGVLVEVPDEGPVRTLFSAPQKPEKAPSAVQEYEFARQQGYKGSFLDFQLAQRRAGATQVSYGSPITAINPATGQPELVRPDNKGGMNFTGLRPPGEAEKPLTEGQAKAVLFASRMQASDQVMGDLARKGVTTTVPGASGSNVLGDILVAMSPKEQQQLVQAKRDFINAVLRRESGAVIAAEEFANADRQYFPQIGDSQEVIAQKARNRRAAIEGMRADVPKSRQDEVDRISGGSTNAPSNDPLGLRGGR